MTNRAMVTCRWDADVVFTHSCGAQTAVVANKHSVSIYLAAAGSSYMGGLIELRISK